MSSRWGRFLSVTTVEVWSSTPKRLSFCTESRLMSAGHLGSTTLATTSALRSVYVVMIERASSGWESA